MTVIALSSRQNPSKNPENSSEPASEGDACSLRGDNSVSDLVPSLRAFKPFSILPEAVINAIAEIADLRHYTSGQTILASGEALGEEVFILAEGNATLTSTNAQSGELTVNQLNCAQSFGLELVLADRTLNQNSDKTLTADDNTTVWVFETPALKALIQARPSLAKSLLTHFANELVTIRFGQENSARPPESYVCEHLLNLVQRDDINGTWFIETLPRHRELAEITGIDEAEVAATVAALIRNKSAERHYPGLIIRDMKAIEDMARQD